MGSQVHVVRTVPHRVCDVPEVQMLCDTIPRITTTGQGVRLVWIRKNRARMPYKASLSPRAGNEPPGP